MVPHLSSVHRLTKDAFLSYTVNLKKREMISGWIDSQLR